MTDLNPVDAMTTPPEKLFAKWEDDILNERENVDVVLYCAWKNGFVAGADQELEACCEWLDTEKILTKDGGYIRKLRDARRPEPPSLKEQALAALQEAAYMADDSPPQGICSDQIDTIRRALEALDD